MLMREGWLGKKSEEKRSVGNAGWKETEPLDVCCKVPVGCKPATRASQEIPDKRILEEERSRQSGCSARAFEQPNRQKILQGLSSR